MVKFQNIDESILQIVQTGGNGAEDPDSLEEDVESDCESDDEEDVNVASPPPAQAFTFEIDVDVDINSKALRDMVSADPAVQEEVRPQQASSVVNAPQAPVVVPNWNW